MNLFIHCICSATTEWDIIWKPRERKLGLTSQASVIATPTLCLVMQLSNTPRTSMMESIKTVCKKPCSRYDSIILSEPLYTMHIHVVHCICCRWVTDFSDYILPVLWISFKAYFTDGMYPDKTNVLTIAEKVGLDRSECDKFVSDPKNIERAAQKARYWSEQGVTGEAFLLFVGTLIFLHAYLFLP